MSAASWCYKYFYLPDTGGRFRAFEYQDVLLDLMSNDEIETVFIRKSTRIGYTVLLAGFVAFDHAERRRRDIVYLPTDDSANIFMRSMHGVVDMVEPLKALLVRKMPKRDRDIRFVDSTLKVLGGSSANNFRQHSCDTVLLDEVDGFPKNIKNEGDPISLAKNRARLSPYRKYVFGSTPTTKGMSLMETQEDSCDVFLYGCVPCPKCKEYFPYIFYGEAGDETVVGLQYVAKARGIGEVFYRCQGCQKKYKEEVRVNQLSNLSFRDYDFDTGEWTIRYENGQFLTKDDEQVKPPNKVGIHVWAAYNPKEDWATLCDLHYRAKGDREKERVFINTILGEYYDDSLAVVELEPGPLEQARIEYETGPIHEVICTTAGVDVQGNRLEMTIVSWCRGYVSYAITHQVFHGDINEVYVWRNLWEYLYERKYSHDPSYPATLVSNVMIDCGYVPELVYQFCEKSPHVFVSCRGRDTLHRDIIQVVDEMREERGCFKIDIGTVAVKELVMQSLSGSQIKGQMAFFRKCAEFSSNYFQQLTSEKRVRVESRGRTVYRWELKKPGIKNEALDCFVYAWAGARFLETFEIVKLSEGIDEIETGTTEN